MKGSTLLKRSLALVLTVVMLFSCWVFTAPSASAASAGSYTIVIYSNCSDDCDNSRKEKFEFIINYKENNGTGTAGTKYLDIGSSYTSTGDKSHSCTIPGFPTKITLHLNTKFNWGWGSVKAKITKVTVQGQDINFPSTECSSSTGDNSKSNDVPANKYPYANSISAISGDASLTLKTDGTTATTGAYTAGTVTDQYGVNWHEDATITSNKANGTTFSNNKISATAACNRASNYDVTLTETCGSASNTKKVSIKTFDYIVKFYDGINSDPINTQTIDYNESATAPSSPSKAYDNTYHYSFDKWTGDTYQNIKDGKQNKTVTASYEAKEHDYNQTSVHVDSGTGKTLKTDATCTAAAVYYNTCICGKVGSTNTHSYGSAKGHDWTKQTVNASTKYHDATCEEAAKYWYSCSRCDAIEKNNNHTFTNGSALGHNWGDWVDNDDATEELGSGTHTATCYTDSTHTKSETHKYGAWQIIPENDTEHIHDSQDRKSVHFRVCNSGDKGCGRIEYAAHKWVVDEVVAPTCTDRGYTTYHCSDCNMPATNLNLNPDIDYSQEGVSDDIAPLGHVYEYYASGTKTDETHQEKCSRCGDIIDVAHPSYGSWYTKGAEKHAHRCTVCDKEVAVDHPETSWSGWQFNVPEEGVSGVRATVRETLLAANYNNETSCYQYCTDCGEVKTQEHPGWKVVEDSAVTFPATCTKPGKETKECRDCGQTTFKTIDPLGHQEVTLVNQELSDEGSDSIVAFYCSVCKQYIEATYSEALHEYTYKESDPGQSSISAFSEVADKVPSPKINYASRNADQGEQYIDYVARGASLKLEGNPSFVVVQNDNKKTLTQNKQILRFIAAINLPDGFDESDIYPNSPKDSAILDFGFVYTQREAYVKKKGKEGIEVKESDWKNILKFNEGDNSKETLVYKMSVAEQNDNKPFVDGWTGCTLRPGQDENDYLTFNLLINVTAKNWACDYLARSYITYKYHGITYTVYDQGHSLELNEYPGYDQDNITDYCYSFNNVAWVALQGICDTFSNETPYSVKYLLIKIWGSRNYWDINNGDGGVMKVYCDYLGKDVKELDAAYKEAIGETNT